ncbi:hypothetical protein [Diaphorobacter aerolatus]|uniref:Uncharacterized protein n=1 Tax=Diaphorobacter aerolatus TaxID=1288495 RepID=A0A7H0GI92_9BURK|nr:hypothetical protein [Diaphorobacter aerolatus]QNP48008.1 hypothetical protein H9K75_18200 [Diaphorobacter aerolatus]
MNPFIALNHLLNFVAPAFVIAVVMVGCGQLFFRQRAKLIGWIKPVAINFIVGCAVLLAGLWYFGNDGKWLSYMALSVAIATTQWVLLRGWWA